MKNGRNDEERLAEVAKVPFPESIGGLSGINGLTRTHWFDGRFMTARAMARDQIWNDARARLVAQDGVAGIVWGLMVEQDSQGKGQMTLDRGLAFDDMGRPIVVGQPYSFALADLFSKASSVRRGPGGSSSFEPCDCGPAARSSQASGASLGGYYLLVIHPKECPEGLAKVHGSACGGSSGSCQTELFRGAFSLSLEKLPVPVIPPQEENDSFARQSMLADWYLHVFEGAKTRPWSPQFGQATRLGPQLRVDAGVALAIVSIADGGTVEFLETWAPRRLRVSSFADQYARVARGQLAPSIVVARQQHFQHQLMLQRKKFLDAGGQESQRRFALYDAGFRFLPPTGWLPVEFFTYYGDESSELEGDTKIRYGVHQLFRGTNVVPTIEYVTRPEDAVAMLESCEATDPIVLRRLAYEEHQQPHDSQEEERPVWGLDDEVRGVVGARWKTQRVSRDASAASISTEAMAGEGCWLAHVLPPDASDQAGQPRIEIFYRDAREYRWVQSLIWPDYQQKNSMSALAMDSGWLATSGALGDSPKITIHRRTGRVFSFWQDFRGNNRTKWLRVELRHRTLLVLSQSEEELGLELRVDVYLFRENRWALQPRLRIMIRQGGQQGQGTSDPNKVQLKLDSLGQTVVIGLPSEVRVYQLDVENRRLNQTPTILKPTQNMSGDFGAALAVTDTHLIVGAPSENSGQGNVYMYAWQVNASGIREIPTPSEGQSVRYSRRFTSVGRDAFSEFGRHLVASSDWFAVVYRRSSKRIKIDTFDLQGRRVNARQRDRDVLIGRIRPEASALRVVSAGRGLFVVGTKEGAGQANVSRATAVMSRYEDPKAERLLARLKNYVLGLGIHATEVSDDGRIRNLDLLRLIELLASQKLEMVRVLVPMKGERIAPFSDNPVSLHGSVGGGDRVRANGGQDMASLWGQAGFRNQVAFVRKAVVLPPDLRELLREIVDPIPERCDCNGGDLWPIEDGPRQQEPRVRHLLRDGNDEPEERARLRHLEPAGPASEPSIAERVSTDEQAGARYFGSDYQADAPSAPFLDAIASGLERSELGPEGLSGGDRRWLKEAAFEAGELSKRARAALRDAYAAQVQDGASALDAAVAVAESAEEQDEELRVASLSLAKVLRRIEGPGVEVILDAWMN